MSCMERAPTNLGFLSAFPDGIYGDVDEIEAMADFSMTLNTEDVDSFFDSLPIPQKNIDDEVLKQMNQMEIDFARSKSREDQKRQHVQKFKIF